MKKLHDDYYWPTYTEVYKNQCNDIINDDKVNFVLKNTNKIENGKILFEDNIYPSWKELYLLTVDLNPSTIFECGCGPAYHLYNIKKLCPDISISGCDLLETQVYLGVTHMNIPKDFYKNIYIADFTVDGISSRLNTKYDMVFTHTVTQHLNHEKCISCIKNMLNITGKYCVLIENRNNHDYDSIFKMLNIHNYTIQNTYNAPLSAMIIKL
jgi:ribosomal protein RSM22 (predicted rRNA methylase)